MSTETLQPDAPPAKRKFKPRGRPFPKGVQSGVPFKPGRTPNSPRNLPRYGDDVKQAILDGIADGNSLCTVLAADGMPENSSVCRWREADPEYEAAYQRARRYRAEWLEEKIIEAGYESKDVPSAKAATARLNCFRTAAAWANPEKYGPKQEITGPGGGAMAVVVTHKFDDARFSDLYLSRTGRSRLGPDAAAADRN